MNALMGARSPLKTKASCFEEGVVQLLHFRHARLCTVNFLGQPSQLVFVSLAHTHDYDYGYDYDYYYGKA